MYEHSVCIYSKTDKHWQTQENQWSTEFSPIILDFISLLRFSIKKN